MSKSVYEGQQKVYFATTIADIDAPTVAEITAATNLTPFLTKDGVKPPDGQNMVDSGDLDSVFDSQEPGSWGGAPFELTMFRDNNDESDAYDLIVYGTRGYLVVLPFLGAGPVAAGDKCEVYPVAMHEPVLQPSAGNENQKFKAAFAVTAAPSKRAVVAA